MRLDPATCRARLERADFGVLATVNPDGSPHLVPVVFTLDGDHLFIPIDAVKDKRTTRLRRVANLERTPVASVLVDHRSTDWGTLWWVRADLVFVGREPPHEVSSLRRKYPQYAPSASIAEVLRLRVTDLTGWAAGSSAGT